MIACAAFNRIEGIAAYAIIRRQEVSLKISIISASFKSQKYIPQIYCFIPTNNRLHISCIPKILIILDLLIARLNFLYSG